MSLDENGNIKWRLPNGHFHRDGGPAHILHSGYEGWHQWNNFHRDGGPARIWTDGREEWYQHGKLHRDDAPAVMTHKGKYYWWNMGRHIGSRVELWIRENDLPHWNLWDDEIKTLFRLKFS